MKQPRSILIACQGSRGDVQPYCNLAVGLKERGWRGFVAGHGLEVLGLGPCASIAQYERAVTDPAQKCGLTRPLAAYRATQDLYNPKNKPSFTLPWFRTITKGCRQISPDILMLVYTSYSGAAAIPALLGLPTRVVISFPIPMTPTSRFSFIMAGTGFSSWGWVNKLQWRMAQRSFVQAVCRKGALRNIEIVCKEEAAAGRPLTKAGEVKLDTTLNTEGCPRLYAFSPAVLPKPDDWPANNYVIGQLGGKKLGKDTEKALPAGLQAYLDDCKRKDIPVIYIGLSVLSFFPKERVTEIFDTVAAAVTRVAAVHPVRAVIQTALSSTPGKVGEMTAAPSTGLEPLLSADVPFYTFSDIVDHSVLFRQASLVICHGGIGTVATALAAGKPVLSIACVPTVDQAFWADRCCRQKLGPKWLWVHKLTAKGLAASILDGVQNLELYTRNAEAIARDMATDDAIKTALELLEKEAAEAQMASVKSGTEVKAGAKDFPEELLRQIKTWLGPNTPAEQSSR